MSRKFSLLLLLGIAAVASCASCSSLPVVSHHSPYQPAHDTTYTLTVGNGVCSGTAVGPNAMITAEHCFKDDKVMMIDDKMVTIVLRYSDGNDHSILKIKGHTFKTWSNFGDIAHVGDEIHFWGNPGGLVDLFRKGYIAGLDVNAYGQNFYDVNGFFGDSGGGIFDRHGGLIGIISVLRRDEDFRLMGSFPIHFTKEQIAEVGIPDRDSHGRPLPNVARTLTTGKQLDLNKLKMK